MNGDEDDDKSHILVLFRHNAIWKLLMANEERKREGKDGWDGAD